MKRENLFSIKKNLKIPFFKMYTTYCANQPAQSQKLMEYSKKPEFAQTLKICESDPRCKGLTLSSYLIKPIQRYFKSKKTKSFSNFFFDKKNL